MPFTLSHTAAILPFSRPLARYRLLSAVTIGSMVPDFGMFSPWHLSRSETHGALALATFSLPVGLAGYWMFQYLIKGPLLEVLPNGAYSRWNEFAGPANIGSIAQWVRAGGGVLAGAVTHLVWDGFTHEGGRGMRMIPALEDPILYFGNHHLMGARALQDGSSLLGLIVAVVIGAYALRRGGKTPQNRRLQPGERRAWMFAYAAASVVATAIVYWFTRHGPPFGPSLGAKINHLAYASVRGLASALVLVSIGLRSRLGAPVTAVHAKPPAGPR